ncbi:MAG: anthranilate synthase component I [Thermoplasmata archaeon]
MIIKELKWRIEPSALYDEIRKQYKHTFLLESAGGPQRFILHSMIGFEPQATITLKNRIMTVRGSLETIGKKGKVDEVTNRQVANPLVFLSKILKNVRINNHTHKYIGGLVGYVSYDYIKYIEKIPSTTTDDLDFPDLEFGLFFDGILYEHAKGKVLYFSHGTDRSRDIEKLVKKSKKKDDKRKVEKLRIGNFSYNVTKKTFENNVKKAKEYIYDGDIFQVVLSKRKTAGYTGDLFHVYEKLRRINPSPYMYYVDFGKHKIIGSSPEMLGRVHKNRVETFPIAGTGHIGKTKAETKRYEKDLLNDEKERAEHNMLVDLARNDIGKIAEFGTVSVPEYMTVERYSHVQHIVSKVTGRLKKKCDALDVFGAIFPAGTVSGAPKIRAMEIIDELEPTNRGPYAGAVGYFSLNGNMDSAITIRTIIADEKRINLQAGAGIVADSRPEKEWEETEHKLAVLMAAIRG